MIDSDQFLERFRLLSRDIQIGIQAANKKVNEIQKNPDGILIDKLEGILKDIGNNWDDFSGWVLISTLENVDEARKNCALGTLSIRSKITRSKKKVITDANKHGVKIDDSDAQDIEIDSYIQYFEQMLDLVLSNAVKYAPRGSNVTVSAAWKGALAQITIDSIGPLVQRHEREQLGKKSFRSENALKSGKPGGGYGLFNVLKLAELLEAEISFHPSLKKIFEFERVDYGSFSVTMSFKPSVR